ncbi:MAG TPA: SAF domain-containing protein [Anaerolineae bacterium]|nr:SAF domain-containing protein [Anaerolineae bacterium]
MNINRRVVAIIVVVVGLLIIVGGVAFVALNSGGSGLADNPNQPVVGEDGIPLEEGQPIAPRPTISDTVEVVISLQTLPRGYQITADVLETDIRLASNVGPNVITDIDEVIGLFARNDIFQGETLTRDALIRDMTNLGQENYGPSSLIPFGYVAMSVPMDRVSTVAYGLDEGDFIDIMLTFSFYEIDSEFRTLMTNNNVLTFIDEAGNPTQLFIDIGRVETLGTGDEAVVLPSELQRPLPVSMIVQNAKVIQVGPWVPPDPLALPTATPDPNAPTATPGGPPPTPTPPPPDVIVIALPPQQQLFIKYALESDADIDYALRSPGDNQINAVQNVDLDYLLQRFNIEVPPDINYVISPQGGISLDNTGGSSSSGEGDSP